MWRSRSNVHHYPKPWWLDDSDSQLKTHLPLVSHICVSELQWRGNWRDSVSNHQPHDCLLNRFFRRRSKKHQSSALLAFVRGIHRGPMNSPHKWPVTRKCFYLMTSSWNRVSLGSNNGLPPRPYLNSIYCQLDPHGQKFSEILIKLQNF